MKQLKVVLSILFSSVVGLAAAEASAASGVVSGHFEIYNLNGNYCDPAVQDCTGATYLKSEFDTFRPFRNARVEVWQGNSVVGQGSSDVNGDFKVSWSSGSLANARVRFFAQDKDNRFVIGDTNGARMNNNTGTFTLVSGTTSGSPQNVGSWTGGSSGSPEWWTQLYWAAELEWRNAFNLVGILQTAYTNVEIRGVATSMPGFLGDCSTSCANGASKRIQIDSDSSSRKPQARMMHEAGHVANYLLKPFHYGFTNYCWDSSGATTAPDGGTCGWSRTGPEWAAAAFEEGFATFSGDNTLWFPNAVAPTSCNSTGRCTLTSSNKLEETHFPFSTNNCDTSVDTPENRYPMSTMRLLWDIYDSTNDADGDTMAEGTGAFWHMYANMANYASGVSNHQIDECWSNTNFNVVDTRDGRSTSDYVFHYTNNYVDVGLLSTSNCSPL